MRCPLCNGPVHQEGERFACQVGHVVDGDTLRTFTDRRLAEALWMAIEALDTEADLLRRFAADGDRQLADTAEEQAAMPRAFAREHSPR